MKLLLRAIPLLSAVSATEGIVFGVLQKNLAAGTYSVESDSIGLPLFTSAFVLMVFATLIVVGLLCESGPRWLARLGVAAFAAAALLAVLFGAGWADPDHWPIAVSFCALALAVPLLAARASPRISAGGVP
jgi:hypothetical protein